MGEIPEWLKPYSKQGAYIPTKEDIEKLEPQSRDEMLLKYLVNSVSHDLSNYYTKSEVDNLVDTIPKFDIKVVQVLPVSNISPTTVYLLTGDSETGNLYDEYIYVDNKWELIGTQTTDLSNYYNKTEVDNLLSAKVNSSDLSTVATSGSYNDLSNKPTIPTKTSDLTNDSNFVSSSDLSNSYYTKTQTDNLLNLKANTNDLSTVATSGQYSDLLGLPSIPTKTSDLTNDSNFVSSSDLSNSYYSKTQTDNLLDTKVDKITGKGLSTEDYTTADKTKLAGIESEANKTVVVQTTGSSTTDVMSQNAVSTQLDSKATTALYTGTLLSSGWSSSAPYTQTVSIQGMLATDVPIVDVVLSSTTSTAISQTEAWSCVSKIETAAGSIIATCLEEKPTIDIPIQLKVVR